MGWLAIAACDGGDGSSGPGGGRPHVADASAPTYVEASETANGNIAGTEPTAYTLDSVGLVITGAFEPSAPTVDCYRFDTGIATDIDVQVFLDGVGLDGSPGSVFVTLDAIDNDGFSTLTAFDYFQSAWVMPGNQWQVCVTASADAANGEAYSIELRAALE